MLQKVLDAGTFVVWREAHVTLQMDGLLEVLSKIIKRDVSFVKRRFNRRTDADRRQRLSALLEHPLLRVVKDKVA